MVQILYGPAPRFSLVQEAILPILQPLKIQPGPQTDGQTDKPTRRHTEGCRQEARGKLDQQGGLVESQGLSQELSSSCMIKLSTEILYHSGKEQLRATQT